MINHNKTRLFTSIDLPPHLQHHLTNIQEHLKKSRNFLGYFPDQARTPFHITLHFLGEQNTNDIPLILERLASCSFAPFDLKLGNLAVSQPYKHTLWLEIDHPALTQLANNITHALGQFARPEKRTFLGHIKIAKIKKITNKEGFNQELSQLSIEPYSFKVGHFFLKETKFDKKGAQHLILDRFDATN